ncbi:MAG: hypothetical protein PWQ48_1445 [Thermotogaceae bacterium]|nr:hypothetical protein [Thermotogaceae bacterium]
MLYRVRKPSRYIGNEWNMIVKDPEKVSLRFALVFPDLYEVGISNFGLRILYDVLNKRKDVYAERSYIPWKDMIDEMRKAEIPLFSLETKTSLIEFDVIGFSLQYELSYTNVLLALELSKIPLDSEERLSMDETPLVIAGGPCSTNPVPMERFVDVFVIGDGEDVINEIVDTLIANKKAKKLSKLEALSEIKGVYVPKVHKGKDMKIIKRLVNLDEWPLPVRQIVPYMEAIHDRGMVEVMRGCNRGCRFCHAGMIYRPVRERNPEALRESIKALIENTGYEEISLLSLSTSDYTAVDELLKMILPDLESSKIAVSIPSTRVDAFNVELANKISKVRKTGLTFAPEAGSQKLRDSINKNVTFDDIFNSLKKAKESGWRHVKLYFMIGLPFEKDEDIYEMANLIKEIKLQLKFKEINVSVATLVPKPHTPFQFAKQILPNESYAKFEILKKARKYAKIYLHDPFKSLIEGIISRGDERISELILMAYKKGAVFDDWDENFNFKLWNEAIQELQIDLSEYTRERRYDENLPWDFIDAGIDKGFLIREYEKAKNAEVTKDCRWFGCSSCGVCYNFGVSNILIR